MAQRMLHTAQILWPAFLVAGVIEMVVFSSVDPGSLHLGQWQPGHQTVYSLAFLAFWALVALSAALSHWMMASDPAAIEDARPRRGHPRRQHIHHHA